MKPKDSVCLCIDTLTPSQCDCLCSWTTRQKFWTKWLEITFWIIDVTLLALVSGAQTLRG